MSYGSTYHVPVLAVPVVEMLCVKKDGVFVDGTLGGGGHFDALAQQLGSAATLFGIDRDADAIAHNRNRSHTTAAQIYFEQSTFSEVAAVLQKYGIRGIDGILLDLGVSSFQIDTATRGFSFMQECELDMRMNRDTGITARELLASLSVEELAAILENYGEVRNAPRMARTLKMNHVPLQTSGDLRECLSREYGENMKYKVLAKVFMALRIAVNDELGELQRLLVAATSLLNKNGRIAVITYHSLEDRIVKEYFRQEEPHCICQRGALMCTCGTPGSLKRITRKPVIASDREIAQNPRSRSARLRVAERTERVAL